MNLASLSRSIPKLHKLIEAQTEQLVIKDEQIAVQFKQLITKDKQLITKDKRIITLEEENKLLRKLRYAHKSEKWTQQDKRQALLFNEAEAEQNSSSQIPSKIISIQKHTRRKVGRKALDPKLLRKEIIHELSDAQKQCSCGHTMEEIDRDSREELDMQPAKYWVNKHIYPQYACKHCKGIGDNTKAEVISAPRNAIILRSFASPGLLAYLCVAKFEDHLPLYRQERIFKRLGVELPRATMSNWLVHIGKRVQPILDTMHKDMLNSNLIMADETTLQVLKEPGRANTTKSYMWLFRSSCNKERPVLLYKYHPTRSGRVASDLLSNFKGCLLTDGYSGYNEVGSRADMIHAGCWAHVRRKFKEAHDISATKATMKALALIQSLYGIEEKIRLEKLSMAQVLSLRQKKSAPIVQNFKSFIDGLDPPPQTLLGKAYTYALNQWGKLTVFLEMPGVPIDNNRIENDIRPFVLGRKNWLFSGSPRGAYASCAIYSLIQTAKANGLDAYSYLRHLFEKLATITDEKEIVELAPHKIDMV